METMKKYCERTGYDPDHVFDMVLGQGGSILPGRGYTGYMVLIGEDSMVCSNDHYNVHREIRFSDFTRAEFGCGSAQLWLQCCVEGEDFVFCTTRRGWKRPAAKLLLEKLGQHVEIDGWKEYNGYTGKKFLLYLFK